MPNLLRGYLTARGMVCESPPAWLRQSTSPTSLEGNEIKYCRAHSTYTILPLPIVGRWAQARWDYSSARLSTVAGCNTSIPLPTRPVSIQDKQPGLDAITIDA